MNTIYKDFCDRFLDSNHKPKLISERDLYIYVHLTSRKNNFQTTDFIKYLICKSLESIQPSREKSSLILKLDIVLRKTSNEYP